MFVETVTGVVAIGATETGATETGAIETGFIEMLSYLGWVTETF